MTYYNLLFLITHTTLIGGLLVYLNNKDNIIIMFIISELLNLMGMLNYIFYFSYFQNFGGEALSLILFSLGAAETAIGITLIIVFVKLQNTLAITK